MNKQLILVDSNIIIDFWKNPDLVSRKIFEEEDIAICGIIQAELIHGARTDEELQKIIKALGDLIFLDVDGNDWIETVMNGRDRSLQKNATIHYGSIFKANVQG